MRRTSAAAFRRIAVTRQGPPVVVFSFHDALQFFGFRPLSNSTRPRPDAMPTTEQTRTRVDEVTGVPPPPSGEGTPGATSDGLTKLPRPVNDASEPAPTKNRSEIVAEFTTRAVKRALLDRLAGAQFEGNSWALEALARFVGACAEGPVTKEHVHLGQQLVWALACHKIEFEAMNAIVIAVIEAGMGIRRSLFDGPSIDFPLGNGNKVKVLVREGTTDSSRDSPLFGHSKMTALEGDDGSQIAATIAGICGPLALISGASGSGKTVCGISVVAHLRRFDSAAGACLRLRCGADWFTFSPRQEPCVDLSRTPLFSKWDPKSVFDLRAFEETYKSAHGPPYERDLVAQHFVLQAIDKVITWHHRKEPTKEGTLVVFLDDAGEYPTFVRAMCSCFRILQDDINNRYSNGKCLVRVIMAGTDIVGEDHRIGSQPSPIFRHQMRPRAGRKAAPDPPNA
jgi:hypothetical protein